MELKESTIRIELVYSVFFSVLTLVYSCNCKVPHMLQNNINIILKPIVWCSSEKSMMIFNHSIFITVST